MLRIHFGIGDLARLRMVASLGPLTESVFALDLLRRNDSMALRPWVRRVRSEFGGVAGFEDLVRAPGSAAELLDLVSAHRDGARRREAETLVEFCRAVVLPHWGRVHANLEQVRQARGRIVIANGIQGLLGSLHPKLHWNPPVLEVHHGPDADVHLNGRGLLLSSSFFLHDKSCLFLENVHAVGMPGLAIPIDPVLKSELWDSWEPDAQALGDLVGHTRAAALAALTDGATTGELAERLGISLAGASKHAAVLRRSGLITTERHRNTAQHELTTLGKALLHSRAPEPATPPPAPRDEEDLGRLRAVR
ncbi:DNA-binding transcriptional ArsR family regulator [Crossiella equi]|uniref:DNA-binding transcriptional ArsR family regulator n=1 Tax=Crossiella equi TaxID=130796 RepID=A0ABS5ARY6_9PSEU|nr:winged helix-turn-helix domain-containing protein [Crossiella equi]MBP2479347.1 DNA-binding transcriptional ArsR family regulator [Crossiella equi]